MRLARAIVPALAVLLGAAPPPAPHQNPLHNHKKQPTVRGERVDYLRHSDSRPSLLGGAQRAREARISATPPAPASGPVRLATTWCGHETTGENLDLYGRAARIKVIYAFPSDRANRFASFKDTIQANVKTASDQVAAATGGRKTLRFDVGTSCGAEYVDIRIFQLPDPHASYYLSNGELDIEAVVEDLPGSGGGGPRNYAVYLDHLDDPYAAGLGYLPLDDTPGAANDANLGGYGAFLLGSSAFNAHVLLHEIGHTLGAVQNSSPHSSLAGHCTDEWDVMCYSDGGPGGPLTFPCSSPERFDCNADDYLNPAPAPGSYLDTHWNVYDSAFMCTIADGGCIQRRVTAQLSNGDDDQQVELNGHPLLSAGFGETKSVDLGFLTAADEITFQTVNGPATYSWGYDLFVDGANVMHDAEGTPGGPGANANDLLKPYRTVRRITVAGGSGWDPPPNALPSVAIAASPENPALGQPVGFRSEASDSDGVVVSRHWDLDGDGEFDDGTGISAARSFPTAGTHTVRVRVTDDDGGTGDASYAVNVVQPAGTPGADPGVTSWCREARKRRDKLAKSVRALKRKLKKRGLSRRSRRITKKRLSAARKQLKRAEREVRRLCASR